MLSDGSATEIVRLFAARWWAVLLRGIIAIAFGVLAFAWPGVTVATLVLLFGFYALVDGVFSLFTAIGDRPASRRPLVAGAGRHRGDLGRYCNPACSRIDSPGARFLYFDLGHGHGIPPNRGRCPPAAGDFGRNLARAERHIVGALRINADDAACVGSNRPDLGDRGICAGAGRIPGHAGFRTAGRACNLGVGYCTWRGTLRSKFVLQR